MRRASAPEYADGPTLGALLANDIRGLDEGISRYKGDAGQGRWARREQVEIRILVSFEEVYRSYQGVIAAAIRVLRPHAEVETATLAALGEEIERFDPDLVICTRPSTAYPGGRIAWVELSIESTRPSRICVAGRYSESTNPTLEMLLAVMDEVEEFIRTDDHHRKC